MMGTLTTIKNPKQINNLRRILAETEGFEPSMRLYTPYSLSRGAPSATRSRFQERGLCPNCSSSGGRLVQVERAVQGPHRQLHVLLVDHDRGLDLAGGDHLDVDPFFAQRTEHLARDADMAAHADTDDADLADAGVAFEVVGPQRGQHLRLQQVDGARIVVAVYREAEVGLALLGNVL